MKKMDLVIATNNPDKAHHIAGIIGTAFGSGAVAKVIVVGDSYETVRKIEGSYDFGPVVFLNANVGSQVLQRQMGLKATCAQYIFQTDDDVFFSSRDLLTLFAESAPDRYVCPLIYDFDNSQFQGEGFWRAMESSKIRYWAVKFLINLSKDIKEGELLASGRPVPFNGRKKWDEKREFPILFLNSTMIFPRKFVPKYAYFECLGPGFWEDVYCQFSFSRELSGVGVGKIFIATYSHGVTSSSLLVAIRKGLRQYFNLNKVRKKIRGSLFSFICDFILFNLSVFFNLIKIKWK